MKFPGKILLVLSCFLILAVLLHSCRKAEEWDEEQSDERLSGGSQTVFSEGVGAFSEAFPTLTGTRLEMHDLGDAHFEATFVSSPAPLFQGLGTIFNSNSCFNCHINDGRGKPILNTEPLASMLFRVSIPGSGVHGEPLSAPGYGGQLQDKATFGYSPEAGVTVNWIESTAFFTDGDSIKLREPVWNFVNHYTSVPAGMMYSARVAPPLHGMGLLEQIDEYKIRELADVNDLDGDGISGKPNSVWDEKNQRKMLGRFGWKSEAATLDQQVAGAYNEDMGVTSYIFRTESSFGQVQYDNIRDEPEVPDSIFNSVVFYVKTLAVPARRKVTDPVVKRGKEIFSQASCNKCHIPTIRTKTDVTFPEASNQLIHPYTDLLLHDMGPGLADQRPAYEASGQEWRTPPLWGIGLTQLVNGHNNYLHDGRARSLMEAVMWHGGEAEASVNFVKALPKADRDALLSFLRSL
ncbi:MAG: c-type cytochrome [Bacteroidetes bacterium]|nr:MAG: c-type cytochrome [Bacteroidota bacterium]